MNSDPIQLGHHDALPSGERIETPTASIKTPTSNSSSTSQSAAPDIAIGSAVGAIAKVFVGFLKFFFISSVVVVIGIMIVFVVAIANNKDFSDFFGGARLILEQVDEVEPRAVEYYAEKYDLAHKVEVDEYQVWSGDDLLSGIGIEFKMKDDTTVLWMSDTDTFLDDRQANEIADAYSDYLEDEIALKLIGYNIEVRSASLKSRFFTEYFDGDMEAFLVANEKREWLDDSARISVYTIDAPEVFMPKIESVMGDLYESKMIGSATIQVHDYNYVPVDVCRITERGQQWEIGLGE